MTRVRIAAFGAVSALGEGALAIEPVGASAVRADSELSARGLRKPQMARAASDSLGRDPAVWLLERAWAGLERNLDATRPNWRESRIALVIGTSSGGMWSQTRAFDAIDAGAADRQHSRGAPYWGPLRVLRRALPGAPLIQVLAACASSAVALGIASELLRDDLAELVIAGGYDAVTPFVAAGFEALGVTTSTRPLPFSLQRDGLALGEGAALLALVRDSGPGAWLTGFGASADAAHPTSPASDGRSLARAAAEALAEAGEATGRLLVSAHATATLANDRAESAVIGQLGGSVEAVHAFKARIGHALGAGSALELLSALDCAQRGASPALEGAPFEPELPATLSANAPCSSRRIVKLASAFGGANAVLVADVDAPQPGEQREPLGVCVARVGAPCVTPRLDEVIARTSLEAIHVRRLDALSALCATAALAVLPQHAGGDRAAVFSRGNMRLERTGVVVGSVLATLEHNAAYQAKLRERGHGRADARRFPATSPNLAPGMVSILFGLGGPCMTVGAGYQAPFEAVLVALELLRGGRADHMLVIAADVVGGTASALVASAGAPPPEHGALALCLSIERQEGSESSLTHLRADILARLGLPTDAGWPEPAVPSTQTAATPRAGWPALFDWLKEQGLQRP